ncbi:MAG: hypothetical protein JXC33_05690 [Deltaproteobacteria bacterium]|nr:hypothetical protein [Deltaproteobacteria bacterium]
MLSEEEVRERAEYCYCVYIQLNALLKNELLDPSRYMEYLKNSSLQLGDDEFIKATIQEGLLAGLEDGGLGSLISLYEGFVHAFCTVIEMDVTEMVQDISGDFLEKLVDEVSIRKSKTRED